MILVNPPFKNLKKWSKKCVQEFKKGQYIILVMPNNRGDSQYYHDYILRYGRVHPLLGRLEFGDLDKTAKGKCRKAHFGVILVHFDPINVSLVS